MVPTDTQKNTIFAFARDGVGSPEAFLLRLADHFTGEFDWVTGGRWAAEQYRWTRINDHDHSFYRSGPETRTAVLVRDGNDTIVAGLSGYTAWGWLYVQWLWVDERVRGQNKAGQMLEAAEREAAARGCHGAYIDTFNPTALKIYQRQGYEPFGVLQDFPKGRTRTFLAKGLNRRYGHRSSAWARRSCSEN